MDESKTQNAKRKTRNANSKNERTLRIDHQARQVWVAKQEIKLSRLEYDVLAYLMNRRGQVVKYNELWVAVWEHSCSFGDCEQLIVRQTLKRLRNKLGTDASRNICTIRDFGVRLEIQK